MSSAPMVSCGFMYHIRYTDGCQSAPRKHRHLGLTSGGSFAKNHCQAQWPPSKSVSFTAASRVAFGAFWVFGSGVTSTTCRTRCCTARSQPGPSLEVHHWNPWRKRNQNAALETSVTFHADQCNDCLSFAFLCNIYG